ncbi:hypothetical protein D3C85_912030 [compost metagenome]
MDHVARNAGEFRVFGEVGHLGDFHHVQVIEEAKEFIEAVDGRQVFVAIADVRLAEHPGGVALGLEQLSQGHVAVLDTHFRTRLADGGQAGTNRILAGDERSAASGAAWLRVVVRDHHAFLGKPIDVGRGDGAEPAVVGRDIHGCHVVDHDHDDIGLFGSLGNAHRCEAQADTQHGSSNKVHVEFLFNAETAIPSQCGSGITVAQK